MAGKAKKLVDGVKTVKEFLKPDWRKIVVFIILYLAIVCLFYFDVLLNFGENFLFGYVSYACTSSYCPPPGVYIVNYLNFVILIPLVYFLACLIALLYRGKQK